MIMARHEISFPQPVTPSCPFTGTRQTPSMPTTSRRRFCPWGGYPCMWANGVLTRAGEAKAHVISWVRGKQAQRTHLWAHLGHLAENNIYHYFLFQLQSCRDWSVLCFFLILLRFAYACALCTRPHTLTLLTFILQALNVPCERSRLTSDFSSHAAVRTPIGHNATTTPLLPSLSTPPQTSNSSSSESSSS